MAAIKNKMGIYSLVKRLTTIAGIVILSASPGWAAEGDCVATSDLATNTLSVPCLEFNEQRYWADFLLTSWSPVQLQLQDYGLQDSACQDDDIAQEIYRGCNYFPLNTGNMWSFNDITWTVSGAARHFGESIGKRVNNMGGHCVSQDIFLTSGDRGIEFLGFYDRERGMLEEPPMEDFIFLPDEMRIGDTWGVISEGEFSALYTLEGLATVTVPAGTFTGTLRLRVDIVEIDTTPGSYTTFFWFAKNVGIIKVQRTSESTPGMSGCNLVTSEKPLLELRSAWINGVSYP